MSAATTGVGPAAGCDAVEAALPRRAAAAGGTSGAVTLPVTDGRLLRIGPVGGAGLVDVDGRRDSCASTAGVASTGVSCSGTSTGAGAGAVDTATAPVPSSSSTSAIALRFSVSRAGDGCLAEDATSGGVTAGAGAAEAADGAKSSSSLSAPRAPSRRAGRSSGMGTTTACR